MNLPDYNPIFIDHFQATGKPYNDATAYNLTIISADVIPGQICWRLIGIHHLTNDENRGNHHAFCDVLDENGKRIKGAQLLMVQDNGAFFAVVDKPANEAGTNFPLWAEAVGTLSVSYPLDKSLPSDKVSGIRSTFPDEGTGTTWGHHSFYFVFQRTKAEGESIPPPDPEEPPTVPPVFSTDDLAMIEAARRFGMALQIWAEGKLK